MTPVLLRLSLILAVLHAQPPCAVVFGGPAPRPVVANDRFEVTPPDDDCPCCRQTKPTDPPTDPTGPSKCPVGCPTDCPCMFCSPGFVPLTDFGCATLPAETTFDPSPIPAAPSRGHAGHHQLPDRPPRVF